MLNHARNFSRGAAAYEIAAALQREIAAELFNLYPLNDPQRILELGCGTGFLSSHYAQTFPNADYTALDLSSGMLEVYNQRVGFGHTVLADAEEYSCEEESLDAIVSASTLQWFQHLPRTLANYHRFLRPGGEIVISAFGPDFFREFRSCAPVELDGCWPSFYTPEELHSLFAQAGFGELRTQRSLKKQSFDDVRCMLRTMNELGFGPLGETPLSQGRVRALMRDLQSLPQLELSYDIVFLKATRPAD